MYQLSPLLAFAEDKLQIVALLFMAAVYVLKIRWIISFPASRDRQQRTGHPNTSPSRGAWHSLFNIAAPWVMASTRAHPSLYVQFVVFHLGIAASIAMSFLIPYAPGTIRAPVIVAGLQVLFAAACAAGLWRLLRRVRDPYIRAISSPDDFFSLALLIVWLAFSALAAPNRPEQGEAPLLVYFLLTAFFLIYVPFSKISHYIYYPFARWYLGRTLGYRGVFPITRSEA